MRFKVRTTPHMLCIFLLASVVMLAQNRTTENIPLKNGDIMIPGTLSYLPSDVEIPLVIFVQGSGQIDRNGNQPAINMQTNYIAAVSDSLTTKGLAFYSYDKRTVVPSNIQYLENISLSDFADDVIPVLDNFKNDGRFSSIHLIGHSQGSLVAMLGITDAVNSFISVAGPGSSIDQIINTQLSGKNKKLAQLAGRHFEELAKTDTIKKIHPMLISLFAPAQQGFIKSWMQYEPMVEIRKIRKPVLILQGDADLQVQVSDVRLLHQSNAKSQLLLIPKMNHLLKEVHDMEENQQSYLNPNFPVSTKLVSAVVSFIRRHDN